MKQSDREIIADVIGRELAAARQAWRTEREMAQAEYRLTVAELRAEVADLKFKIHEQAQTIKDGAPGAPGERGPAGEQGRDGVDGKDGAPGAPGAFPLSRAWSDRIHYQGEIVTHQGSTWQASRDTAAAPPDDAWSPLALRGDDAPVGEVRGLYDPSASYRKFDLVTFDNSEWRAVKDDPGPLPGDGWIISAKRGKPGIKGERGEPGERGPPGRELVALKVEGWQLVAVLSDGRSIRCDARPLLELYHAEVA